MLCHTLISAVDYVNITNKLFCLGFFFWAVAV